ncbi:MAG: bifunctional alpha,alpha-trehalose-phosphate synthase (UDP-forming)/trehalose-phosphatase [Fibrobacteria bacterium]
MSRLIIVSNRLPFTIAEKAGKPELQESSGGLVTALGSYLDSRREEPGFECLWVGWPGAFLDGPKRTEFEELARIRFSAHPVWLQSEDTDQFYHGFCNRTLWPLFHYLPSLTHYDEAQWEAYKRVNAQFGAALADLLRPDDTVWVQDYQLFLLPKLLREAMPGLSIGFFLHIPFPSFELFRLLPTDWKRELLEGMLGADLVGFHTHDYTQYFLRSVHRTLGYEHHLGNISMGERISRADTFPLGIDFMKYSNAAAIPSVLEEQASLAAKLAGQKIISSVDRLDYTKGILHRLKGYRLFLEESPEWQGKVAFILSVVPSRVEVDQYQRMKKEIDEAVGKINGEFGNPQWMPVLYQYRNLTFHSLVALYAVTDVALITPLRDGMNLVAKEFIACKPDGEGVLILSEMAGAAREMGEALIINPNHDREIAKALSQALTMPIEERIQRSQAMRERLRKQDARHWAETFEKSLHEAKTLVRRLEAKHLAAEPRKKMLKEYRLASRRLLLLDYDGTLVPFASHPKLAFPDPGLLDLLKQLSGNPRNTVFVISGRQKKPLKEWLGGCGIGLIAEHGVWMRGKESDWKLIKPLDTAWKAQLLSILEGYVDRLTGSFVEEKEFSLAWHYRNSDQELGAQRAKELIDTLIHFTANFDVQVLEGKKVIEVRCAGVNKGTAAIVCRESMHPDFTMAIGDDVTDEDLFRAMPRDVHTIRVGMKSSYAGYNVRDFVEVRGLLEELAQA